MQEWCFLLWFFSSKYIKQFLVHDNVKYKGMSRSITLYIDKDTGLTLKTLYDICIHAGGNYKELHGIHPMKRHECGLAVPYIHPTDENAVFKIKLKLGWNKGTAYTQDCAWNIWIPENWQDELPTHRLFNAGISRGSPKLDTEGTWDQKQKELDSKADSFARCTGPGIYIRQNKIIATLDCSYGNYGKKMPSKMFNSLKQALKDMGYLNKSNT